jgi:hypothetical protein
MLGKRTKKVDNLDKIVKPAAKKEPGGGRLGSPEKERVREREREREKEREIKRERERMNLGNPATQNRKSIHMPTKTKVESGTSQSKKSNLC